MELSQVLFLFISESIFFILVLSAALKFAARRHRSHLNKIIEQVNQAAAIENEVENEKLNNEEMRRRLMAKIRDLQVKLNELRDIERAYKLLKEKYDLDKAPLKNNTGINAQNKSLSVPAGVSFDGEGKNGERKNGEGRRHTIKVGTTVDRDPGVDQNYLNYLAKKKCLNDASNSSHRASAENKAYHKKIQEQRDLIANLQNTVKDYETAANVKDLQSESKNRTLASLKQIEQSLIDSQNTSEKLEVELHKVKLDLQQAQNKVSALEREKQHLENEKSSHPSTEYHSDSYTVISRKNQTEPTSEDNELFSSQMRDYEALKSEVEKLRLNTTEQRKLVFELEAQIIELRKELNDKDLDAEEHLKKEQELQKLERLLMETEGCVEVLESEVDFLQERINSISKIDEDDNSKDILKIYETEERVLELSEKLEKSRLALSRTAALHEKLADIMDLTSHKINDGLLENLAARVLQAVETLSIDAHLKIISKFGQVDVANCKNIRKDQLEFLEIGLKDDSNAALTGQDGFVIAFNKVGVFAKADPIDPFDIGSLEETLGFILMVSDAVATTIDERYFSQTRQTAMQRLMGSIKKNLSSISIQNKYQADEVKKLIDNFVSELYESLNTLNITSNQSRFFEQMVEEVRARMEVLFATEAVVDDSFKRLIEKLEKNQ